MSGYVEPVGGTKAPPSATRFGSKPIRAAMLLLQGNQLDSHPEYGPSYIPLLDTPFGLKSEKLRLYNPAGTFYTTVQMAVLANNQKVRYPVITNDESGVKIDDITLLKQAQSFNKKTIRIDGTDPNIILESAANVTHVAAFDASGNLVKRSLFTIAADGNKIPMSQINDNTKEKWGRFSGANYYEVRGDGLLDGLYGLGTVANNIDASGSSNTFKTWIVANARAGIVKVYPVATFNGWMRSNFLPTLRFKNVLPARTSGDSQFWFGWYTTQALIPVSSNPMNVNDGGVLIGYNSTDSNIMIYYGPADGSTTPPTPINTGLAIPTGTIAYIFEIIVNSATSYTINIFNTAGAGSLLYTTTITTNLPAGTKSLNFHNVLQNMTTTDKTITIYTGNGLSIR